MLLLFIMLRKRDQGTRAAAAAAAAENLKDGPTGEEGRRERKSFFFPFPFLSILRLAGIFFLVL